MNTLASESITREMTDWSVREKYAGSDHQYITYKLQSGTQHSHISASVHRDGMWQILTLVVFTSVINTVEQQFSINKTTSIIEETVRLISRTFRESTPKKQGIRRNGIPEHWWSEEITDLRREYLRHRSQVTRMRRANRVSSLNGIN